MSWLEVSFTTHQKRAQLERCLDNLGALAVTLVDPLDNPILEPLPGETPVWDIVRITALFENTTALLEVANAIWEVLPQAELFYKTIMPQNWQHNWHQHFEAKHFNRFSIYPDKQTNNDDTIPIFITPGLAFGTGNHETTHMCLNWLDAAELKNKSVIDFGCGSGILAIAAKKLGAQQIYAVDHDNQALLSTQDNIKLNEMPLDAFVCCDASTLPNTLKADIVIANILVNPLVELAPKFMQLLKTGGNIALSGILTTQLEKIEAAYSPFLKQIQVETMGDWALFAGVKA